MARGGVVVPTGGSRSQSLAAPPATFRGASGTKCGIGLTGLFKRTDKSWLPPTPEPAGMRPEPVEMMGRITSSLLWWADAEGTTGDAADFA